MEENDEVEECRMPLDLSENEIRPMVDNKSDGPISDASFEAE